jgi:hypothetical protein
MQIGGFSFKNPLIWELGRPCGALMQALIAAFFIRPCRLLPPQIFVVSKELAVPVGTIQDLD